MSASAISISNPSCSIIKVSSGFVSPQALSPPNLTSVPKPPEPKPKDFHINETADGFSVVSAKDANPERFPQTIRIEAAYDVASGNPFKKYNPLDFKLGKNSGITLAMTTDSAKLISSKENIIRLEVKELPFKLNASGFDVNRDLKVKLLKEA